MFYVIDRSTLRKWFVGMLLAIVVVWLLWQTLTKDPVFKSGGEGMVLWRQIQSGANRFVPVVRKPSTSVPAMAPTLEAVDADILGEALTEDAPTALPMTWLEDEEESVSFGQIVSLDAVDEYLPMLPVYGSDAGLAIPAAGQLFVAVEPLAKGEAFAEFRWNRDRSRSRQLEAMQDIMTDATSSEEQKAKAQARLIDIMANSEIESELEGLLMAQGLPDAVVILGETGATVMVDTVLTEEEAARIGDTVSDMTGVTLEKIRIIDQRS